MLFLKVGPPKVSNFLTTFYGLCHTKPGQNFQQVTQELSHTNLLYDHLNQMAGRDQGTACGPLHHSLMMKIQKNLKNWYFLTFSRSRLHFQSTTYAYTVS